MIIFSEELLSHPYILQNTLDVYIRDHEMRRNIRLFVSNKNAEAILKTVPSLKIYRRSILIC